MTPKSHIFTQVLRTLSSFLALKNRPNLNEKSCYLKAQLESLSQTHFWPN